MRGVLAARSRPHSSPNAAASHKTDRAAVLWLSFETPAFFAGLRHAPHIATLNLLLTMRTRFDHVQRLNSLRTPTGF
jgi:hypothetical protein